jgi:hypothetical protein
MRATKEIQAKIDELEGRIVVKEKMIEEDKATINCLNHDLIYEEIRKLMAMKLSLNWALGNANNL